jgi:hypothetical protein
MARAIPPGAPSILSVHCLTTQLLQYNRAGAPFLLWLAWLLIRTPPAATGERADAPPDLSQWAQQ